MNNAHSYFSLQNPYPTWWHTPFAATLAQGKPQLEEASASEEEEEEGGVVRRGVAMS